MYFNVIYNHERWYKNKSDGSWDADNSYDYQCIVKSNDSRFDVVLFPKETEPKSGDEVYLVVVNYSSGDQFGSESNIHEMLCAFTDQTKAIEFVKVVYEDYCDYPSSKYDPINFNGFHILCYSWKGNFKKLNDVEVIKLNLR